MSEKTNLSAQAAKSALPNTFINTEHTRGLHSRGGENRLVKNEADMPEMWREGGVYYIEGRIVSQDVYLETLRKFKRG